ncbi:hypothetical protein SAMN05216251_103258 [Actinacidiphila alni]|uniref:Uncharacterized protein n=1 Tax=Actinacidiphila alni TaxID=380248 RepID=A0A1I2AWL1_9ACTN|nr:hypothetical protein SAMN05216251_103258 [Actinacidiphila alni]
MKQATGDAGAGTRVMTTHDDRPAPVTRLRKPGVSREHRLAGVAPGYSP